MAFPTGPRPPPGRGYRLNDPVFSGGFARVGVVGSVPWTGRWRSRRRMGSTSPERAGIGPHPFPPLRAWRRDPERRVPGAGLLRYARNDGEGLTPSSLGAAPSASPAEAGVQWGKVCRDLRRPSRLGPGLRRGGDIGWMMRSFPEVSPASGWSDRSGGQGDGEAAVGRDRRYRPAGRSTLFDRSLVSRTGWTRSSRRRCA